MNEKMKCYNIHGHTYIYELTFQFNSIKNIGYAIDFKEIKRIASQWIDDMFDHGAILNPKDKDVILACQATNSKLWLMSLNGIAEYCNPSAENISKEIFLGVSSLMQENELTLHKVRLWETPNCYTDCYSASITQEQEENFLNKHRYSLSEYKTQKGTVHYDDRAQP